MRKFMESVSRLQKPVLFFSHKEELDEISWPTVTLTNFDSAAMGGRFVYECEVDTANIQVEGQSVIAPTEAVSVLHVYDTHCPDELIEAEIVRTLREFRPEPGAHVALVTGKLARTGLARVMKAIAPEDFTYELRVLDIAVAAWLTTEKIADEFGDISGIDLVMLPGKVQGDEDELGTALGVPVIRGPACYSELPSFLEASGVEIEATGNLKPKITLFGNEAVEFGKMLAGTYEVPFVDAEKVVMSDADEGDETAILAMQYVERGEEIPHYLMAEIVRSRLIMPDVVNGFVLVNYPRIPRDAEWLVDMKIKPDAWVNLVSEYSTATDIVEYYRDYPGFISINVDEKDAASDLYTKLEEMFQACVIAD